MRMCTLIIDPLRQVRAGFCSVDGTDRLCRHELDATVARCVEQWVAAIAGINTRACSSDTDLWNLHQRYQPLLQICAETCCVRKPRETSAVLYYLSSAPPPPLMSALEHALTPGVKLSRVTLQT